MARNEAMRKGRDAPSAASPAKAALARCAALMVIGWPGLASAKGTRLLGSHIDPIMFAPSVMAVLLAPLAGSQIARTGKYGSAAPWLAGVGVLATLLISEALFSFGPLVTPIPQIIVMALMLRSARRRSASK
jgi:hypothetical protein